MVGLDATDAACNGLAVDYTVTPPRDAFFPERGTAQVTARDAKRVCNGFGDVPACPILAPCLEYALDRKERFGIWGGKSERERARIAKDRRVAAERELEDLEAQKRRERRRAAALVAWETRRRRAVEQEQAAQLAATRIKESSGTQRRRIFLAA